MSYDKIRRGIIALWDEITRWCKEQNPIQENDNGQTYYGPRDNNKENTIASGISTLADTISKEAIANREEYKREDSGKKFRDYATLLFVILTTVGIFWQGCIFRQTMLDARDGSNKQSEAMKEQQSVMQGQLDEMRAERRPWVSSEIRPTFDVMKNTLMLSYTYRNSGHAPAYNIGFNASVPRNPIPNLTRESTSEIVKNTCGTAEAIGKSVGDPLFPDTTLSGSFSVGQNQVDKNGPRMPSIIITCIAYSIPEDTKTHHTSYVLYTGSDQQSNVALGDAD